MRHTVSGAVLALSVSAVLCFGCGSGAPPSANSFTEVYTRTIQPKCSTYFCHYYGVDIRFGALDMSSRVRAYWSLVGQPCMGAICSQSGMRVAPWQPEASVMYVKVLDQLQLPTGIARCGTQMPADTTNYSTNLADPSSLAQTSTVTPGPALPIEEQQRIHDWIQEGAQDN